MSTKKHYLLVLAVLMTFSLLLSGCAAPSVEDVIADANPPAAVAVQEEAAEEPVEEPVEEPAEEPADEAVEEPVEALTAEEALDANLTAFLTSMEGFNSTTPDAVYTQIVDGDVPFMIDVRSPSELEEKGHIEGAINIPLKELAQNVDKLPATDTPIVVYCGVGTRAAIAGMALGELGYTDVKTLQGGSFGGWVEAGYAVVEGLPEAAPALDAFQPEPAAVEAVDAMLQAFPEGWAQIKAEDLSMELVDGAEVVFLDVRSAEEVAENGQIEGAVHIPLNELVERQAEWPSRDASVVTYCAKGYRGNLAMTLLRAYGYENIRNLSGGLPAWQEAGLPVVGGEGGGTAALDANFEAFFANMEGFNSIKPADLNTLIIEGNAPVIIDIRNTSELEEKGHIEGAINIPLKELAQNVDKLPGTDTPIVVYCGVGTRAAIGGMTLAALGYTDVKTLQGGSFGGWVEAGLPVADGVPEAAPVLNAFEPDPAAVEAVDAMLQAFPEGWAQVKVEDLNLELVEGSELIIVDVRSPEELAEKGQIEGAVNIPLPQILEMRGDWPSPDADIVVYCGVGYRGNLAMTLLRAYGYENIRNVSGGFGAWQEAGFPVITQ